MKIPKPVLDWSSHSHESLLYVGGIFCTSFHERDADLISKSLQKWLSINWDIQLNEIKGIVEQTIQVTKSKFTGKQYTNDRVYLHHGVLKWRVGDSLPEQSLWKPPSELWDRTCFQQEVCSHYHLHIDLSHSTIAWHYWSSLDRLHHKPPDKDAITVRTSGQRG